MQPYEHRLHTLQKQILPGQAYLITQASDLTYFTGFRPVTHNEREGFLLVTTSSAELFAAAFSPLPSYLEQAVLDGRPVPFLKIARTTQLTRLAVSIAQADVSELFIDDTGLFLSEFKLLQGHITAAENPSGALSYRHIDRQTIWAQRVHKDEFEVKLMRKAAEIANIALTETVASLQEGQTEKDVAHFFERRLYELGADGPAFPTIVAFGDHATLPHHQPGKTTLTNETPVLIDCGAMVEAYNSDMTRTIWYGDHPSAEFLNVKQIVDRAYDIGIEQLRLRDLEQKAVTARDIDTAVRDYISAQGFGDNYIHTTGHGIGIDVHEPPSLYLTNSQPIEDGMMITIEPGIYLPLKLGYRYENTLLVTSKAPEELTK